MNCKRCGDTKQIRERRFVIALRDPSQCTLLINLCANCNLLLKAGKVSIYDLID